MIPHGGRAARARLFTDAVRLGGIHLHHKDTRLMFCLRRAGGTWMGRRPIHVLSGGNPRALGGTLGVVFFWVENGNGRGQQPLVIKYGWEILFCER